MEIAESMVAPNLVILVNTEEEKRAY